MKKFFATTLLLASTLAGCHHDAPPPAATVGPVPAYSFVRQGDADLMLQHDKVAKLYLRDDLLIVYTQRNDAYSLNRNTLLLNSLAQPTTPNGQLAPPVVFQNTIIYPTGSALQIFNHAGVKLGEIDLHRALRTPLIGSGSILYTGVDYEHGGRVSAIDPSRPDVPIRWEFLTNSGIEAGPAYANGILYIGTESGVVIAAQDQEGSTKPLGLWRFQTAGPIVADLKADNTGVYVASTDTKLYCLDPNTGHVLWQYFGQHPLSQSPTITATRVYQAVPEVGLVALNKTTGGDDRQPLWTAQHVAQILSEDDRCVYVLLTNKAIAAIDKQTGKQLFASHRHDFVAFATNTRDGTIYAATANGQIYAIQPVFTGEPSGEVVMTEVRMKVEG